jgi:hypothetical protein
VVAELVSLLVCLEDLLEPGQSLGRNVQLLVALVAHFDGRGDMAKRQLGIALLCGSIVEQ